MANVMDTVYKAKNLDIKFIHICYIFMDKLIEVNGLGINFWKMLRFNDI